MSKPMNFSFLSKDFTQCLKGLFALFVLWHHISQQSMRFYATNLGTIFQMMGYLSVAMFFFISGYGLMKKSGSTYYLVAFPRKRILTFYIDTVVFVVIYSIATLLINGRVDGFLIVKSLTWGGTIIANGWYFQVALLLYLLFYFSFRCIKNIGAALVVCCASVFVFCFLCMLFGAPSTIYESVLAFPLGLLFGQDARRFEFLYRKIFCGIAAGVIFIAAVVGEYLLRGSLLGVLCKMASAVAFVLFALVVAFWLVQTKAVKILINPAFAWIGERSFEVYALQGLFLHLFKGVDIVYHHLFLYALTTAALTLFCAAAIHIPIVKLNRWLKGGEQAPTAQ